MHDRGAFSLTTHTYIPMYYIQYVSISVSLRISLSLSLSFSVPLYTFSSFVNKPADSKPHWVCTKREETAYGAMKRIDSRGPGTMQKRFGDRSSRELLEAGGELTKFQTSRERNEERPTVFVHDPRDPGTRARDDLWLYRVQPFRSPSSLPHCIFLILLFASLHPIHKARFFSLFDAGAQVLSPPPSTNSKPYTRWSLFFNLQ